MGRSEEGSDERIKAKEGNEGRMISIGREFGRRVMRNRWENKNKNC